VPFNAEDYVHRIGRTGRAGASGLAVTFAAGGNDVRLVADIEKLIKKKIELEPVEFEEDRPRGRINDGRRRWRDEGESGDSRDVLDMPREPRSSSPGSGRAGFQRPHRPSAAPRDPFFDKPYEAGERDKAPAWEPTGKSAPSRGVSANIKSKRKVAALFKAAPETTTS